MATGGSAHMRGFATGVGSKADIGAWRPRSVLEKTSFPNLLIETND